MQVFGKYLKNWKIQEIPLGYWCGEHACQVSSQSDDGKWVKNRGNWNVGRTTRRRTTGKTTPTCKIRRFQTVTKTEPNGISTRGFRHRDHHGVICAYTRFQIIWKSFSSLLRLAKMRYSLTLIYSNTLSSAPKFFLEGRRPLARSLDEYWLMTNLIIFAGKTVRLTG